MQSDFLAKVHTMYNQFTKAEKKVADFILQNPKRVLFMSITELVFWRGSQPSGGLESSEQVSED